MDKGEAHSKPGIGNLREDSPVFPLASGCDRLPVESAGLGVVVRGAGWQIAHCYGKPFEQPLSQRPHLHVQ